MATLVQIIEKKAKNEPLSPEDVEVFVKAVASHTIDEAQIGAFLMAVRLNDMTEDECASLTNHMCKYGERLVWENESWAGHVVDKHSTGGVGDKISLVLAPALAACGAKVPMISGRGLGFTGGTLDKLEAIPGFKVEMDLNVMKKTIEDVGVFIAGQTPQIAPVDKKLYSIRDISGTVYSDPLIVSSIMSKKLVEGLAVLLLDVKVGRAAIMNSAKQAGKLASKMVGVGLRCGVKMVAFLTKMDHPIGFGVGNALEVADALQGLNDVMSDDQRELVIKEGGILLYMSKLALSFDEGQSKIAAALADGSALAKFQEMITAQGVSADLAQKLCDKGKHPVDYYLKLMKCDDAVRTEFKADAKGFITDMDALEMAHVARDLGAGRATANDKLDYSVGFYLRKKVGDRVDTGDVWTEVYHRKPLTPSEINKIHACVKVEDCEEFAKQSHVIKVLANLK